MPESPDFDRLIQAARRVLGHFQTDGCVQSGDVAAAILDDTGKIFTGVCIDAACGIGFCAEHAAVAEMLKQRSSKIMACVAVTKDSVPVPPCGRCRELMYQLSPGNLHAQILVGHSEISTLEELLPHPWDYTK